MTREEAKKYWKNEYKRKKAIKDAMFKYLQKKLKENKDD